MSEESKENLAKMLEDDTLPPPDLPFDLNDLCNLKFTFDTLKQAVEWLAKQQALINKKLKILGDEVTGLASKETELPEVQPAEVTKDMYDDLRNMII
mmetsp:Transcript_11511/g.17347  ORF Transcript_11511/g.17347 Transcript_11511/m.17347 type:complete len:97 (-) Transcript_11511:1894-2184(-)